MLHSKDELAIKRQRSHPARFLWPSLCKTGALLERFRSGQCPAQPLPPFSGGELPVPLPAPAALLTGGRCRP